MCLQLNTTLYLWTVPPDLKDTAYIVCDELLGIAIINGGDQIKPALTIPASSELGEPGNCPELVYMIETPTMLDEERYLCDENEQLFSKRNLHVCCESKCLKKLILPFS